MDAVLAQALAREAMKKKPELRECVVEEKKPEPTKEPQILADLKKSEGPQKKELPSVNSAPLPKVELKKSEVKERPTIEVNQAALPKVELKKAAVKERPTIEVNKAPAVNVQLKKAEVKEKPVIEVNKEPAVKVQLKKTPDTKPEEKADTTSSTSVPTVTLRHREVDNKSKTETKTEEPKLLINLRKPGKGRFKNLEQYYQD
jgi:hypothetical protein